MEVPLYKRLGGGNVPANLGRGDSTGDFSAVSTHDGAIGLDDSHGSAQSVVLCQSSCIGYTVTAD